MFCPESQLSAAFAPAAAGMAVACPAVPATSASPATSAIADPAAACRTLRDRRCTTLCVIYRPLRSGCPHTRTSSDSEIDFRS
ncbi:hypothetical protein GCM10009544_46810 [Streptomyces stramineus]|uniref:Secreted protein n=1 Tax=Streptomyces stramineus TaxID=173861 RepID=A0ABN1ALI4_9ACTN